METRRSAMVRLRTALNLAVMRGHGQRNVATLVELPQVPKAKHQPPRVVDLRRLLDVIRGDRLRALVYVALGASLRRAEVLGLHWEGVDFETRQVLVHRRVNRLGKGIGLIVRDGAKSDSGVWLIALPQMVVDELQELRKYRSKTAWRSERGWKGPDYTGGKSTGFIFTSEVGTVLEPRSVDEYFVAVRTRAGLDEHTFHGLHHNFAGLLLAAKVPGRVVSEMMGHASYSITANIYQHVPDELQRLAADSLDGMLRAVTSAAG